MNINGLNSVNFGNNHNDYYNYSQEKYSRILNVPEMLNVMYNKLLQVENNQKIITENQQAIQEANRKAFNTYWHDGFRPEVVNSAFQDNKINVIA